MKKLVAVLLLSLLLGSCGIDREPVPTPIPASGNDAQTVILQDNGPAEGGTLRLFATPIDSWHPLQTKNSDAKQIMSFVFDSLVVVDGQGHTNRLAESIVNVDDGKIWDIELRAGITFSDGTALSEKDLLFTMESLMAAGAAGYWWNAVSAVQSVERVDVRTVRIILKVPKEDYPIALTFPIVPKHLYEDWKSDLKPFDQPLPVGTGAYVVTSREDEHVLLNKRPGWWFSEDPNGLGHPVWIDQIDFLIHQTGAELITAFQRQMIDIAEIHEVDVDRYTRRKDLSIVKFSTNQLEYAISGEGSLFLRDPVFREAIFRYVYWNLSFAQEKENFSLDEWSFGGSEEMQLNREDLITLLTDAGYRYNADKNILTTSASTGSKRVAVSVIYNRLDMDRLATAEWMAEILSGIGILSQADKRSDIEEMKLAENGRFDLMLLGCNMPVHDDINETLPLLRASFQGIASQEPAIIPLYRKQAAVLYHTRLRGPKKPLSWDIYSGWTEWYIVTKP